MKQLLRFAHLILLISGCFAISSGQAIILEQTNGSGIYERGEKIEVSARFNELNSDFVKVKILRDITTILVDQIFAVEGEEILLFEGVFDEATAVIVEVRSDEEFASTGFVVDPDGFTPGSKRPKDFDKYWKKEKKMLRKLPMDVTALPLEELEGPVICSSIEITCTGPKPVRGYFAKPEKAEPGSLPIVLYVRAAGVAGHWCQSKPEDALNYAKKGNGALAFDLNAHGMLVGQPQMYYDSLERGELKDYAGFGRESREDIYFRGMYLRLIRTLDFLCSQPEWDGKRILVLGESQGGGQSLAAAGLDPRVSAVVATVPAMCDWGAALQGSKGGWPNLFDWGGDADKLMVTLPYFDVAHLLNDSQATIVTEIGFIDYTCPPASIYAALNQAKGEKIVFGVPYRGHHLKQEQFRTEWTNKVYDPKIAFIEDYLK